LTIILGAAIGALLGSRIVGLLENPQIISSLNLIELFNNKTIMGGLFGGLLGVELAKRIIGEKASSGDLFTFPIIVGIIVGRIGCFLSGTDEFTYGTETSFFLGMDLGDGVLRHPIALYEIVFLILLFVFLYQIKLSVKVKSGTLFKYFMLLYFGFRFSIEFLKPNEFLLFQLSTIQYLCVICYIYYFKTIINLLKQNSVAS
jgi:prolipoprotein diacylglyceryltransferase